MTSTSPSPTASPSASTVRQLELTINALARCMRKALRAAEREDPQSDAASSVLWQQVEQRQQTLVSLMAAASAYFAAFTPRTESTLRSGAPSSLTRAFEPALDPERAGLKVAEPMLMTPPPLSAQGAGAAHGADSLVVALRALPGSVKLPLNILKAMKYITDLEGKKAAGAVSAKQENDLARYRWHLRVVVRNWCRNTPDIPLQVEAYE